MNKHPLDRMADVMPEHDLRLESSREEGESTST